MKKAELVDERVGYDPESPWFAEHRARYLFARSVLPAEGRLLDVACGSGLGADLLASPSRRVLGIDLSLDAARSASELDVPGFVTCQASGTRLPMRTAYLEAVTSFETLEHVREDEVFLRELRRVLRPEGVLVLSTPNALVTKPVEGVPANPFHVREYTPAQLREKLDPVFTSVELFGQVTNPDYGSCPFFEPPEKTRGSARARTQALVWKAIRRLPDGVAPVASRAILRRELFPKATDWSFDRDALEMAHVLVAICRP